MTGFFVRDIAEPECVQVGDWPGTHREDISQDTTHSGRGSLIGLDKGGVIVAFHLEDRRLSVADINDAGIFTRAADHPGSGCRQGF